MGSLTLVWDVGENEKEESVSGIGSAARIVRTWEDKMWFRKGKFVKVMSAAGLV